MAAVRRPVLLGLRDAAVRGHPTGPGAWTASKLGGLPVRAGAGERDGERGRGRAPRQRRGLSASLAFRTPCPAWRRRGRRVRAARSRSPWSCRCTARWRGLRFTGYCTCSLAPAPAAATAGRAGRPRARLRARAGAHGDGVVRSRPPVFTLKLEGVPLPVPAGAGGGGAGPPGRTIEIQSSSIHFSSLQLGQDQAEARSPELDLCLGVRGRDPSTQPSAPRQEDGLAAEDWCEGADDWGSDSEEAPAPHKPWDFGKEPASAKGADWTARLQHLCLQDAALGAAHPTPPGGGEGAASPPAAPQFLPHYICVVDEDDYRDDCCAGLDHARSLLRHYVQREGVDLEQLLAHGLSADGDEKYEKTVMKSGDQTFYKFMKRIAACQEQILRYSWSGEPLFLTCPASQVAELPACGHCGGQRTFEFQLMPALVSMLKGANSGVSVEFGTILVYTCEKSCWPQNHQTPMEEFCITQEDPDDSLFK